MTHRFFIYGPFALFVALVAAVSGRWWVEANAYSHRLDAMNGKTVMPGVVLRFSQKRIGGFPFRMDATFKNFDVEVATPHGPSHWQAEDFALHRLTYGTARTLFEAAGRQRLSWTDEQGHVHALAFAAGSMRASASEDEGGLAHFDLELFGFGSPAFTADHLQLHGRRDPFNGGFDLIASAAGVAVSPALHPALGKRISSFTFASTFLPGAPLAALRAGKESWSDALKDFGHANGSMHVNNFDLAFEGFEATGHGRFGVDSDWRPRGLLDIRVIHVEAFVAQARKLGLDRNGKGIAAALLARTAEAGSDESGRLGVVFTCSDGIGYLGTTPVGTLGTLL